MALPDKMIFSSSAPRLVITSSNESWKKRASCKQRIRGIEFEPATWTYGVLDIRDPHESAVVVGGVVDIAGAEVERRHSVEVHKSGTESSTIMWLNSKFLMKQMALRARVSSYSSVNIANEMLKIFNFFSGLLLVEHLEVVSLDQVFGNRWEPEENLEPSLLVLLLLVQKVLNQLLKAGQVRSLTKLSLGRGGTFLESKGT